jgi:hypothetical protein
MVAAGSNGKRLSTEIAGNVRAVFHIDPEGAIPKGSEERTW